MNARVTVAVLTSAAALLTVAPDTASAQGAKRWRGSQGWGRGGEYARLYDARTVETVKGEVVGVESFTPRKGMGHGVHLLLKTDKETLSVHLGPLWFVENQDVEIEPKDVVEVRGSRVMFDGKPALIAAEVTKDGETLRLRDQDGDPAWAGWRRR